MHMSSSKGHTSGGARDLTNQTQIVNGAHREHFRVRVNANLLAGSQLAGTSVMGHILRSSLPTLFVSFGMAFYRVRLCRVLWQLICS
jgi:hypothetical protein